MYKLLLSWRYLRTRFIALASIVSVTLGVATLIVVNSVMAGFVDQMKNQLHGILSDVEIAAPIMGEISYPERHVEIVREVVGDELEAITCVVRTHALLSFEFRGRKMTQHVMLLGIDDDTFGNVTDFSPYLTNALKRDRFSFDLENQGYEKFEQGGWDYRRKKIQQKRDIQEMLDAQDRQYDVTAAAYLEQQFDPSGTATQEPPTPSVPLDGQGDMADGTGAEFQFAPLPNTPPSVDVVHAIDAPPTDPRSAQDELQSGSNSISADGRRLVQMSAFDPHSKMRPRVRPEDMFDEMKDQHTGIILGLAISARKSMSAEGEVHDIFMVRPGDDVQIMLTTVGANLQAVMENCTIVDFYSSNMHEYDSSFAFMPLSELQKLRGMVDPLTGSASVSTIQIKLKPGADLDAVRDRLIAQFPPTSFSYDIHTWEDTQRPLLSAVRMELTILNILLFMIIAVAGFGILATFFMIVVEKTKDIGILKALGAPSRGVMSIFLGYGMSLGAVGTGVGIVIGLLFVHYINEIADLVSLVTGQEVFSPEIYFFSEIPTLVSPMTVMWVAFGAIMIAVMASVLPALRAARLHPVEALRYE